MSGLRSFNLSTCTRIIPLILLIMLNVRPLYAEDRPDSLPNLARLGVSQDISATTYVCFSHLKTVSPQQLPGLDYSIKGTSKYAHFITPSQVNDKAVLKFTLSNSSDQTQSAYFCPGFYYDSIQLYRLTDRNYDSIRPAGQTAVQALPSILPPDPDSLGYRKITLAAHDTGTFYAVLTFVRCPINSINPSLSKEAYATYGILFNHKTKTNFDIITNLFAGIMLMMILYGISEYLQTSKPEFIYYAGYCFFISMMLFFKATLHNTTTSFNYFFESFLDNIMFCLGHLSYIIFHRKFLETRKSYKSLDRIFFWGAGAIALLTVLYTLAYFLIPDFRVSNTIEDCTKYVLIIICLLFIIKGMGYHNQLMNYIVMGNISLFGLALLSQLMIATNFKLVPSPSVLNLALFHYEVGITIELIFFLIAITYKNKMEITLSIQKEEKLKLETERKELEKQVAVLAAKQDERNRISADMHDELGSGVTAIRLMSEIVKSKMKDQVLPEIEKISHSANELLNKMNTIIWTMTSSNDSVENLVAYVRSYAVEFFENTSIDCYFSMPASIPHREINGEKRRNMFLSVKEALNNVLKHSQSSVVKINVSVGEKLVIEIQDDGVGINMDKLRKFGNGLHNMKKRMNSIDGEFEIANHEGTRTTFGLLL